MLVETGRPEEKMVDSVALIYVDEEVPEMVVGLHSGRVVVVVTTEDTSDCISFTL